MAKKGLKRGLEHLFDDNGTFDENINEEHVENIPIQNIVPNPYQPRKTFNEESLEELAQSIKINGVFQPILVRSTILGYELISGERRFRASQKIGLEEIPAIVYQYDDKQMMEVALVENIQREDLNVVDEANSYLKLMNELDYTQEELSKRIGKSRSHIANITRIVALDQHMLDKIIDKSMSLGHAKLLVGIKDQELREKVFNEIMDKKLNVRQTEDYIKNVDKEESQETKVKSSKDKSEYKQLEDLLIEKLSTKVSITGKEQGQIKIDYLSEEDLERLLEILTII